MLNSGDEAALKSYVTATQDVFRAPYSRNDQVYPRLHATYSSTNKEALILARDGVRRWWWLNIDQIEIGILKDGWPIMQLWAQIKHLLVTESQATRQEKAPWHLTKDELTYLESYITSHTSENSLAEKMYDVYDVTKKGWNDSLEAHLKVGHAIAQMTSTQSNIAESLGVDAGKGLIHTLVEQLRRIAPKEVRVGKAVIRFGLYKTGNQTRYMMPTKLTGDVFK